LAERVARAWFDALGRDVAAEEAAAAKKSQLEVDFRGEQRTRANARFLAAARSLAEVRRLALPALRAILEEDRPGLLSPALPMENSAPREQTMPKKVREDAKSDQILSLMQRSTQGDHDAFQELKTIDKANGIDRLSNWSRVTLTVKLQSRASPKNLLARNAVSRDLKSIVRGLAESSDGAIERMIIDRVALCAVDAGLADHEHVHAVTDNLDLATVEALDRRRDRAHRRMLQTLKTLAQVRRMNRVAVQVNVGDGNLNVLKV
jgi:hypothetical protein